MPKNKKNSNIIYHNQQGFSLLLVILILAAMLGTTLIVSNIVLEVGRTLAKAPHSEVALYAAEAGIEKALYKINKNYTDISPETVFNFSSESGDLGIDGSTFTIDSSEGDVEVIRKNIDGTFNLAKGRSLELDCDLNGIDYGELTFEFSGDESQINNLIISVLGFDLVGGAMTGLIENRITPASSLIIGSSTDGKNYHKIRIYNPGSDIGFTIRQSEIEGECQRLEDVPVDTEPDVTACPIVGVKIISHGRYKNTERVVEVENMKWHRF